MGFVNTKLTNITKNDERIINAKQRYLFSSEDLPTAKQVAKTLFDLSFQDLSLMNGNTLNLDGGILCQ